MKNEMIKNTLILTMITLVSGLLLGLVYEITKEPIGEAQAKATQEAYAEVFAEADEFVEYAGFDADEANEYVASFEACVNDTIDGVVVAYADGEEVGYVITVTAHDGYGGDITFTMGVTNDYILNGISFLSISETAGLGMNATKESFSSQFANIGVQGFQVVKTGSTAESEIDAISGATITSEAVTNGVNAGLLYWEYITGGVSYE
ncbi:MAG: RnfABCDGE type electron transport complex subunit G [Eubacteriales bacterium]